MKRNKFQRVQLPRQLGLNAENSVLVRSMTALRSSPFVKKRNKFSVRTYYSENETKKSPHLVTTSEKTLFKKAPKLFKDGLWLIVADKIDAKDCEFRGCIWITDKNKAIVEIAVGPGTVRTVTNKTKIDLRYELSPSQETTNVELNHCVARCRSLKLRSLIFEFSYYNIQIGWKNERFICWEITDDGTHQCRLFKERK